MHDLLYNWYNPSQYRLIMSLCFAEEIPNWIFFKISNWKLPLLAKSYVLQKSSFEMYSIDNLSTWTNIPPSAPFMEFYFVSGLTTCIYMYVSIFCYAEVRENNRK